MPKSIQFEGKSYSFPDDASDQEILGFLDQQSRPAPRPAPKPAPRPAPQPSAMPTIMDTFARAGANVQQTGQGGARAVQTLTAPMAPESLHPAPAAPNPGIIDSVKRGAQGLKTTFDLAAYGLERGARRVIGDNAVDIINAADAARGIQSPEQSLADSLATLNAMPVDPGVQHIGEAFAGGGVPGLPASTNFVMKLGSAGKALVENPSAIPHLAAEMLPSLPLGGAGGKVLEAGALKAAEELAPRLAPTIARSAFGAGFGTTATLENAGPNAAAERAMDPNASLADIATRGTVKTLGQLPGGAAGGAFLPFRVAKGSPSLAVRMGANAAAQAGIQGAAGVASVMGGNATLGRPTTEQEGAAAAIGNATLGALGLGVEALNARRMAGEFEARRAAGGVAPEAVSPVGREAAPHPDGGFAEDSNGFVADAEGKPVSFGAEADGGHVNAARFAAKNGLGGSHDISIITDDQGVNHAVLKRRPAPAAEGVTEPVTPAAGADKMSVTSADKTGIQPTSPTDAGRPMSTIDEIEAQAKSIADDIAASKRRALSMPYADQKHLVADYLTEHGQPTTADDLNLPYPEWAAVRAQHYENAVKWAREKRFGPDPEEPPPAPPPPPAAPAEAAPPAVVDPLSVGETAARGAAPEPMLADAAPSVDGPRIIYRGTTGSSERIKGGIGEGLVFAAPTEEHARLYGDNIEQIAVRPEAKILKEGTAEFRKVTGRRGASLIRSMRPGENMKTAGDDAIEKARAAGYDAVEFESGENGIAIINEGAFDRNYQQEGLLYDADGTPGRNEVGDQGRPLQVEEARAPAADEGSGAPAAPAEALKDGGAGPLEDRSGIASNEKGSYRDTFMEASFTNRPSVYESAIHAAGLTPERFRLLAPERQAKVLGDELERATGVKATVEKGMPLREAIDQMLDAHQTVQGMAHVLGISPSAISLGGKLKLELKKNANFLGAYAPGNKTIYLPGRSNSFAHEWAHALDFHLLDKLGSSGARGITAQIRQQGAYFQPQNVRDAFVGVMNAMFFNDTALTQRVLDLQTKINSTTSAQVRAQAKAELARIMDGSSKARGIDTAFYQGAKHLNAKQGEGDYWTQPTEMFARAFEAYVSRLAYIQGFGTEFIGKGDANYQSVAEERFEKSFPHGEDREKIFEALDNLVREIANEAAKDGDAGIQPHIGGRDISRISQFDKRVKAQKNGSAMKRQMDELRRFAERKAMEAEGRATDPKGRLETIKDVWSMAFFSMAGELKMLARRYNSPTIMQIHDHLTWDPGSGRYVKQTFHEEVSGLTNKRLNRVANLLATAGYADGLGAVSMAELRRLLTNAESSVEGSPELIGLANGLRRIMDELYYEMKNAGIDVGYVKDQGYLSRVLDMPRIQNSRPDFIDDATMEYQNVWDRDMGADAAAIVSSDEKIADFSKAAKRLNIGGSDKIAAARKALAAAQQAGDNRGAVRAADALEQVIADMFDGVRSAWAREAAEAWDLKLWSADTAAFNAVDALQAGHDFAKGRSLTKNADQILAKWYVQDPIETVYNYIVGATRRVAYEKRFGGDTVENWAKQMSAEGVDPRDAAEVIQILKVATGRARTKLPPQVVRGLSWLHASGSMMLMPRAVWSSVPEPFVIEMITGRKLDGLKAFSATLGNLIGTLKGDERAELANALGIVADSLGEEMIVMARFGGMYGNSVRADRLLSNMFRRTGLTGLTRAQRRAMVTIGTSFLDWASRKLVSSTDPNSVQHKELTAFLTEFGISDVSTFVNEWVRRDGQMDIEGGDLETKFGKEFGLFMRRIADSGVQEPSPMDRSRLANSPVGRILFSLLSFNMSYWRKVQKRAIILMKSMTKRSGVLPAAWHFAWSIFPAYMAYLGVTIAVSAIREFLMNGERLDEMKKKGHLEEHLLELGVSRATPLGVADPALQSVVGLKYQRDLTGIMAGAHAGFYFQQAQLLLMSQLRDSDAGDLNAAGQPKKYGTNTAEFNSARAMYNMFIAPPVAIGLSALPGGPILSPVEGALLQGVTAPQAGKAAGELIAGPKGSKTDEDGNIVEGGGRQARSRHGSRSGRSSSR